MSDVLENLRDLGAREYDKTGFPRLLRAGGLLIGIFVVGTLGYWSAAPPEYTLLDCAYMTTITLTTVGYGEVIPVEGNSSLEAFTIGLIIAGMGIMLYFVSSLTAFIIEGELRDLIRMRRMDREIDKLENHLIICGIGKTGVHVLREVLQSNQPCVVIERSRGRIDEELEELGEEFLYIVGDATHDNVLQHAGIERATGLIASLGNDRDNLFVTITARSLNEKVRIVSRGEHPEAEQKFKMAGATSVIYTNVLGGLRMAAEAIRPEVTTFLDLMMQDHEHYRRVEELPVPNNSPLIGLTIRDTRIRQHTDALVIAVYREQDGEYIFNPGPDYEITTGTKLIVLTLVDDIETLEALIRGEL
ncbi:potassium channel protein [Persicimonas caeni]|uniref:Potassium channel protein n=1 Tax=Persicimonas caeni TaxID=2292766 RepID=A0A4Y6PZK4_PERCE|nr:potassium channel protein [Persicimonas caeni]QDG53744.1 potassium channel protein [Persicimonas caeni]QED34965.1 potassium channel protein [Persicimonas caeni]